ncbi:MAG: hypothetical protein V7776_23110 [Halopseudomonas aestusnigri]
MVSNIPNQNRAREIAYSPLAQSAVRTNTHPKVAQNQTGKADGSPKNAMGEIYKELRDGDGVEETTARGSSGKGNVDRDEEKLTPSGDLRLNRRLGSSAHILDREQQSPNSSQSVEKPIQTSKTDPKSHIKTLLATETSELKSSGKGNTPPQASKKSLVVRDRAFNPYVHGTELGKPHQEKMEGFYNQPSWKISTLCQAQLRSF